MKNILLLFFVLIQVSFCMETSEVDGLSIACEKGLSKQCIELGDIYILGNEVEKNYEQALNYYIKACELKDSEGCFAAGNRYNKGRKNNKNKKKAVKYYQRSCDMNNGKACNNLGNLYKRGDGVQKDYDIALKLFDKACKSEDGVEKGCANKEKLIELMKNLDINETDRGQNDR